jgi:hypothetical protein
MASALFTRSNRSATFRVAAVRLKVSAADSCSRRGDRCPAAAAAYTAFIFNREINKYQDRRNTIVYMAEKVNMVGYRTPAANCRPGSSMTDSLNLAAKCAAETTDRRNFASHNRQTSSTLAIPIHIRGAHSENCVFFIDASGAISPLAHSPLHERLASLQTASYALTAYKLYVCPSKCI